MILTVTTQEQFTDWLKAGPHICVYHIGNLAEDVYRSQDYALRKLRNAVWTAAFSRDVYLLQRRPEEGSPTVMEYLAIKPVGGKVPSRFAPELEA